MKIAAVIRELISAGVAGDALVAAVERIEAARTTGADRQARYRERKRNVTSQASHVTMEPQSKPTETPAQLAEREYFSVGKALLGARAGGLLSSLLRHNNYDIAAARAVIDAAATKQDPREWVSATMRTRTNGKSPLAQACADLVAGAEAAERTVDLEPGDWSQGSGGSGGPADW